MFLSAVFQDPLNDSAPISMNAQSEDVVSDRLNDEVESLRRHLLNALLNHMVSILVMNAVQH